MSQHGWLERLQGATAYAELQAVFSEMAATARRAGRDAALAASIDDAIHRIEQERLRDEDELREFEQGHEQFKQQQSGVVGWFKRHIPFTETRRQEKEHQQAVADQRAEVLADNLVIARAQMIKEQLLDPNVRRTGHAVADWRLTLAEHDKPDSIWAYATHAQQLESEITKAQAFVAELKQDVDAFAKATFSQQQDRVRKDTDLAAARHELEELQTEVKHKESLFKQAIERTADLVREELHNSSPEFRDLSGQIERLEGMLQSVGNLQRDCEELRRETQQAVEAIKQRDVIPETRKQTERELQQAQQAITDQQRSHDALRRSHAELALRFQTAQSHVDAARAAATAADRVYEAYLKETGRNKADTTSVSAEVSPVESEHLRSQQELQTVEREVSVIRPSYDASKRDVENAAQALQAAQLNADALQKKLEDFADRESRLHQELELARTQLHSILHRLQPEVLQFMRCCDDSPCQSVLKRFIHEGVHNPYGQVDLYPSSYNDEGWQAAQRRYHALATAIDTDQQSLRRELQDDLEKQKRIWTSRCQQLLGDDLAKRMCAQTNAEGEQCRVR